jgi:hypothetical protein
LDDDAVIALAGDGRVDHAGAVDAAADDLDRLLHRLGGALLQRRGGQGDQDPAGSGGVEFEIGLVGEAVAALGRERLQRAEGGVLLGGVRQRDDEAVLRERLGDVEAIDPGAAQAAARLVP